MNTRINKFLAERGVCSRRKADELIQAGEVRINGKIATMGEKVSEDDEIHINGELLKTRKPESIYIAFNKPVGLITSVDPRTRDNVIEHIGLDKRIFPIGRLDVASQGLLLLTNDGNLSERITHPKYYHEKEYLVKVDKKIKERDLDTMRQGMVILGEKTKKAGVIKVDDYRFKIILTEGKNRQIRRMCEQLGYEVKFLQRLRVMNIELGNLEIGQWRYLSKDEVYELKKSLDII